MIINYNSMASNALRQLNINSTAQAKSMAKLSSGLRINTAADDAAGLAISEKMKGQIRGLDQASRNAQDGQSMINTAEGALSQTTDILQRMRELATQSSNDTNTSDDRNAMQLEVNQLSSEIDRIGNTTQFNTKSLLNGNSGFSATVAAGTGLTAVSGGNAATGDFTVSSVNAAKVADVSISGAGTTPANGLTDADITAGTFTLNGVNINVSTATVAGAVNAINNATAQTGVTASVNSTTGQLELKSAQVGSATQITLTNAKNVFSGTTVKTTDVTSGGSATSISNSATTFSGTDASATAADGATGTVGTLKGNGNTLTMVGGTFDGMSFNVNPQINGGSGAITVNSNASLTLQIGANQGQTMSISINDMRASALGVNALDLTTQTGAENAITSVDNAIKTVSAERAKLGAYSNRLDNTINNLNTSSQNTSDAQSRIADVDMAKEMMNQSKSSVLAQAAQAMLAQANQQPQQVLQLLRG